MTSQWSATLSSRTSKGKEKREVKEMIRQEAGNEAE